MVMPVSPPTPLRVRDAVLAVLGTMITPAANDGTVIVVDPGEVRETVCELKSASELAAMVYGPRVTVPAGVPVTRPEIAAYPPIHNPFKGKARPPGRQDGPIPTQGNGA